MKDEVDRRSHPQPTEQIPVIIPQVAVVAGSMTVWSRPILFIMPNADASAGDEEEESYDWCPDTLRGEEFSIITEENSE